MEDSLPNVIWYLVSEGKKATRKIGNMNKGPNQLLSENKLHSLNSTYNFCALENLQVRFQNSNLNRDSNLGSPDH